MSRLLKGRLVSVLLLLIGASSCSSTSESVEGVTAQRQEIVVAAASDLRAAFTKVAADFSTESQIDVTLTFGGSGQLKRQIEDGAPVDLFASADRALVEELVKEGLASESSLYTYGFVDLALATAKGVAPAKSLEELSDQRFRRIAIANPSVAPYGRAAQQAIGRTVDSANVTTKLILAENVADALRLVESGDVDAAIVATALTRNSDPPLTSAVTELPATLFDPIAQGIGITAKGERSKRNAQAFLAFLKGPSGKATMKAYGFQP